MSEDSVKKNRVSEQGQKEIDRIFETLQLETAEKRKAFLPEQNLDLNSPSVYFPLSDSSSRMPNE